MKRIRKMPGIKYQYIFKNIGNKYEIEVSSNYWFITFDYGLNNKKEELFDKYNPVWYLEVSNDEFARLNQIRKMNINLFEDIIERMINEQHGGSISSNR